MRDDGLLSDCLLDGNAGIQSRPRSLRQRALAAALLLEAAVLTGLTLRPLLTPGMPAPQFVLLARVPYPGEAAWRRPVEPSGSNSPRNPAITSPLQPVSAQVLRPAPFSAQNVAIPSIGSPGPEMPYGRPGMPFGSSDEPWVISPPKPATGTVRVVRRSEGVEESQLVSRLIPSYPQIARAARISGVVELEVLVGRDGRVLSVQVLGGSPLLAAAAKQAVKQWCYRPAILDGQAVEVEARVTVSFVLDP